jgi:hypothetical protein
LGLAAIERGLDSYEAAYATKLFQWQDRTIEKILSSIKLDAGKKILEDGLDVKGGLAELKSDLVNIRTRIANFGRGQVTDEIKRQKNG